MLTRYLGNWLLFLVIWGMVVALCGGQEPTGNADGGMAAVVDVEFNAVDFVDSVQALNDRYGYVIRVGLPRLESAGIQLAPPLDSTVDALQRKYHLSAEQTASVRSVLEAGTAYPVTYSASNVTLRSALRHMVLQVHDDMRVVEVDDAAVITTREQARETLLSTFVSSVHATDLASTQARRAARDDCSCAL